MLRSMPTDLQALAAELTRARARRDNAPAFSPDWDAACDYVAELELEFLALGRSRFSPHRPRSGAKGTTSSPKARNAAVAELDGSAPGPARAPGRGHKVGARRQHAVNRRRSDREPPPYLLGTGDATPSGGFG